MKHKSKKSRSQHQANSKETDSKTILWIIKIIINIQRKMEDNACMNKDVKNNKDSLKIKNVIISLVQSFSHVWLSVTPWTAALQASLSITNFWSSLRLMSIELVMQSNHLILCCPFSSHLQSFPASGSFQMSQLFASGGQSIGVSASTSVLPINTQDWFP